MGGARFDKRSLRQDREIVRIGRISPAYEADQSVVDTRRAECVGWRFLITTKVPVPAVIEGVVGSFKDSGGWFKGATEETKGQPHNQEDGHHDEHRLPRGKREICESHAVTYHSWRRRGTLVRRLAAACPIPPGWRATRRRVSLSGLAGRPGRQQCSIRSSTLFEVSCRDPLDCHTDQEGNEGAR